MASDYASAHQAKAAFNLLDSIGIEQICSLIESGKSQQEIADQLEIGQPVIAAWLRSDPDKSARAREAMENSAESWLDKGMQALERAAKKDSAYDASAARDIAKECARRAGIRNAAYRERAEVSVAVDPASIAPASALLAAAAQLAAQHGLAQQLIDLIGNSGRVIDHGPPVKALDKPDGT